MAICNDYNPNGVVVVVIMVIAAAPQEAEVGVVKYLLLLTVIYLQM